MWNQNAKTTALVRGSQAWKLVPFTLKERVLPNEPNCFKRYWMNEHSLQCVVLRQIELK